ncbi:MAG: hypothetical protein ACJ76D_09140 [Solirubrobacterales bacterium]
MSSVLRSLRSPAVIISILALVAGITGAAVAGPIASTSKLSKKDKKQVRKIADSEINKLAPGLSVKSAATVAGGGVTQKSFKQAIVVTVDIPSTALGDCGSLDPPALAGVASGSTVIMTPPSGKPIDFTVQPGMHDAGGVYVDYCNIAGGDPQDPNPANYRFNIVAP